jgi:hypothetical protein
MEGKGGESATRACARTFRPGNLLSPVSHVSVTTVRLPVKLSAARVAPVPIIRKNALRNNDPLYHV